MDPEPSIPELPILSAEEIRQSFSLAGTEIHVLRGVSISIPQASTTFLCGASGAGKSTLMYILAGLERPKQGTVLYDGKSLYARRDSELARLRNSTFGFIFQAYHLLPELTALENVLLPAMIGHREALPRAKELLDRVGLGERLHHLPFELSGGEQQRVAIARALVNNPKILFADEPTGNLDSKTGEAIIEMLLGLVRETGKTLVVVTHDASMAARGDRTLYMRDGELLVTP